MWSFGLCRIRLCCFGHNEFATRAGPGEITGGPTTSKGSFDGVQIGNPGDTLARSRAADFERHASQYAAILRSTLA